MKLLLALTSSLVALGCATNPTSQNCEDGRCDSNGGIIGTRNPNVALLGGYSTLFDKALPACVEVAGQADTDAGSLSQSSELVFVESREELARELGVDLDVQVKYAGVADGNLGLEMLSKYNVSSSAVTVLLKYESDYLRINRSTPKLTPAAQAALEQGPEAFYRMCGDRYVNAIRYGSSLYIMLTYETEDEDSANSLKAKLSGSGGSAGLDITADVETNLVENASASATNVTMTIRAEGARTDATISLSDLSDEGLTEALFTKIDQMVAETGASLRNDLCHDSGDANCSGPSSRVSAASGISVGFYDPLVSDPEPLIAITEQTAQVRDFITHWTRIQERARTIYEGEIAPFLRANNSQQARFQVLPPAAPAATVPELTTLASRSDSDFYPETGFFTETIGAQIEDCWGGASLSLFTDACDHSTSENVAAFADVEEALYRYDQASRVVPMRVRIGTEDKDDNEAADYCRSFNTESTSYRLPVLLDSDLGPNNTVVSGELAFIAPLVAYGNVEWNGDSTNEIWIRHADPEALCSRLGLDGSAPAYVNDPASPGGRITCHSGSIGNFGHDNTVICVPDSGPISSVASP